MQLTHTTGIIIGAICALAGSAKAIDVIELTPLGGGEAKAHDINDHGEVVGQSVNAFGHPLAARWDASGSVSSLGALPGMNWSVAESINNNGEIVGYSEDDMTTAFSTYWDGRGGIVNVHSAIGAQGTSVAWDINDNGLIVGQAPLTAGFSKGFIWDQIHPATTEGSLPFYMGGANYGVNNNGELVGSAFFFGDPDDATHATPDDRGGYEYPEISPPGRNFSQARAINNNGLIVGHSGYNSTTLSWNACIFTGDDRDPVQTLGTLDGWDTSEAADVNDNGMIVGHAWDGSFMGKPNHAWVYADGEMYDLNDYLTEQSPFSVLYQALGVNNEGDIVGFGELRRGGLGAFLIEDFAPPAACAADLNDDGELNFFDVSTFLNAFNAQDPIADFDRNDEWNFFDVSAFLNAYNAGCP